MERRRRQAHGESRDETRREGVWFCLSRATTSAPGRRKRGRCETRREGRKKDGGVERAGSQAGRRGRGVKTGRGADGYGEETHTHKHAADRVQYSNSRTECWLQLILTSKSSSFLTLLLPPPQSVCNCDSHVSVEPPTVTATPYFILTLRRAPGQAHKQAGAVLESTTKTAKKNKKNKALAV